ncbi:uncharacterized protein BO80DRAFT_349169, partial [Aspergillus ibericus CBS 121593]
MPKTVLKYIHPLCGFPLYDANRLQEPPSGANICGMTKKDLVVKLNKTRVPYMDLLEFHAWGYIQGAYRYRRDMRKADKIAALIKILYNQDDKHRPRSLEELYDVSRDTGPRLLKPAVATEDLLPISRYYPSPPAPNTQVKPGFVRPIDAPDFISDVFLERMAEKSVVEPELENQPSDKETASQEASQDELHINIRVPAIDREAHLPLVEAIERVVMNFAYSGLERDPTAASLEAARPYVTATEGKCLTSAIFGSFPATSQVQLAPNPWASNSLHFDKNGHVYPYRGRGPVWSNCSSAVDCAIVAGRLLDAGSTKVDRDWQGWQDTFTPVERAFIEATDLNWDVCPLEKSIELRDRFLQLVQPDNAPREDIQALRDIWHRSTHNFDQFRPDFIEIMDPCQCSAPIGSNTSSGHTSIGSSELESSYDGLDLQDALSRLLAISSKVPCKRCGNESVNCRKRYRKLPLRLAVEPGPNMIIQSHCQDLTLAYPDEHGREQIASYRWLGGIYSHKNHMRLYWNDVNRGEHDNTGMLRMYDSTENLGVIVGGIAPASRADRVPEEYWRGKEIPLLFYERIMNPNMEDLHVALSAVNNMLQVSEQGKLILQQNPGW